MHSGARVVHIEVVGRPSIVFNNNKNHQQKSETTGATHYAHSEPLIYQGTGYGVDMPLRTTLPVVKGLPW